MLVAVKFDTLGDKLFMVKTKVLVESLAERGKEVDVQALCYTLAHVNARKLIYTLTNGLLLVEEDKVGNMPVKVERKAVLDTMADRKTEVKVHTLGEHTLAGRHVKVYTKALNY